MGASAPEQRGDAIPQLGEHLVSVAHLSSAVAANRRHLAAQATYRFGTWRNLGGRAMF
ncbi:hypothetical protein MM1S1540310_2413 [Mycobacteroides abscessus subsp. bolletii 1S-154-0310]|nr:hypothetical protein MM1S1510930_2858 [Mycobacteroides abscessus subsp. bolletii 1S-151-0930]EIU75421.1 hypothetical protein MM1S1530915_2403 [Mycobacteroides abscessus subsp. bolletii 1S-153-0915]EIU80640.1 hypothetical protein MM1S1540310_2413 [Mycobacteroides abscessus subsp. bolletii 1S-154-0310]ESV59301.1 hypothetical protein L830_1515 [Mycobacteroides abscessus MAB_082312_2258]